MSEQEVRDGLAALVVDEPPLAFDPDALMAKADAAVRRRRTLVGASGATVVIAAAAVALPIVLRGGTPGGVQATPGNSTVITTTVPAKPKFVWPPAHYEVPAYTVQTIEEAAHRLQNEAGRVFPRVVPEATNVHADLLAGEAEGDYNAGQLYLNGAVHYRTKLGKAAVDIQVSAGASVPGPTKSCPAGGDKTCKIRTLADGSMLVVTHWSQDKMKAVTVEHYRFDGVVVSVSGYNTDSFAERPTPDLSRIPVSEAQLTAIATDKALTL
jgi:hypothetical protein